MLKLLLGHPLLYHDRPPLSGKRQVEGNRPKQKEYSHIDWLTAKHLKCVPAQPNKLSTEYSSRLPPLQGVIPFFSISRFPTKWGENFWESQEHFCISWDTVLPISFSAWGMLGCWCLMMTYDLWWPRITEDGDNNAKNVNPRFLAHPCSFVFLCADSGCRY